MEAIRSQPEPKIIQEIRNFLGLASFYQRFVKSFSSLTTLLLNAWREGSSSGQRKPKAILSFLKRMWQMPMYSLPDFHKLLEVECDVSNMALVLFWFKKKDWLLSLVKKLNDSQKITQLRQGTLCSYLNAKPLGQYFLSKPFVLFSDHEALKYIKGQHKLNWRRAPWVGFLQAFKLLSNTKQVHKISWQML